MLTLSELYDPKKFVGVSQQTRTDIIQTMGFDVDGLTKNEGGKLSEEELCEGLRYLLATNKDLHSYVERTNRILQTIHITILFLFLGMTYYLLICFKLLLLDQAIIVDLTEVAAIMMAR